MEDGGRGSGVGCVDVDGRRGQDGGESEMLIIMNKITNSDDAIENVVNEQG